MNAAALLGVLASEAEIVGGSNVTASPSVVLAGVEVSVPGAVDALAAAPSTTFLSFVPSVKIALRATNASDNSSLLTPAPRVAVNQVPLGATRLAVERCELEHGPFRCCGDDDDDDDDVEEEPGPPQEDDESAYASEPTILNHLVDPAVEELAKAFSKLSLRRVKFGNVFVQEYCVTIGDHPLCDDEGVGGYPIGLDWQRTEVMEHDLEWYEGGKPVGVFQFSAEGRKLRVEAFTGMDR